jgi:hypothetical protein
MRLHLGCNRGHFLPERIMRVRIKESSFCLRALRATLASFRMAAARSTLAHVPTKAGTFCTTMRLMSLYP